MHVSGPSQDLLNLCKVLKVRFGRAEMEMSCREVRGRVVPSQIREFPRSRRQPDTRGRIRIQLYRASAGVRSKLAEQSTQWPSQRSVVRLHSTLLTRTRPRDSEQPHQRQNSLSIWSVDSPKSVLLPIRDLIKLQASALTTYKPLAYHSLRAIKSRRTRVVSVLLVDNQTQLI